MRIYGIKSCDTCRKAIRAFPDAEFVDIRETPLSAADFSVYFEQFGTALVNARSTTWRGLSAQERERDPIALLVENPTLMKRPLIEINGALFLGWTEETQTQLGLS